MLTVLHASVTCFATQRLLLDLLHFRKKNLDALSMSTKMQHMLCKANIPVHGKTLLSLLSSSDKPTEHESHSEASEEECSTQDATLTNP